MRESLAHRRPTYRVAVVGCGAIGALFELDPKRPKPATHAGAAAAHKRTRLVALIDSDAKRLAIAGKLFPRTATFTDVKKGLAATKPDIVAIATPPESHLPVIRACNAAGVKAIICEKPLGKDAKDGKKIARLLAKTKMVFVLNYQRRFFPQFKSVRQAIGRGAIGSIEQVSCYYSNGVHGNASHIIDSLAFLLGDPITEVNARYGAPAVSHPESDRTIDALMRTKKNISITLQGLDQSKWGINEIRIYGERGALVISNYGYTVSSIPLRNSVFGGVKELALTRARSFTRETSMVVGALEHALFCLEHKKKPDSGVKNGLYVEAVIDALLQSAAAAGRKTKVVQ